MRKSIGKFWHWPISTTVIRLAVLFVVLVGIGCGERPGSDELDAGIARESYVTNLATTYYNYEQISLKTDSFKDCESVRTAFLELLDESLEQYEAYMADNPGMRFKHEPEMLGRIRQLCKPERDRVQTDR